MLALRDAWRNLGALSKQKITNPMNIEDRLIFIATPNGETHKAIEAFHALANSAYEAQRNYASSIGARAWFGRGGITALLFEKEPTEMPKGFRRDFKSDQQGMFAIVPDKKTKDGKARAEELKGLPRSPDLMDFSKSIGFNFIIRNMRMMLASFETLGETRFVTIPKYEDESKQFIPPDCTTLKLSEYYAMKESSEEKK